MISVLPGVLTPTHLRLMEIVGRAANQYQAPNLRLEGGTALAAYYLGLHAICDRFAERDFVDLHVILTQVPTAGETDGEADLRARFRRLALDLFETDAGLYPAVVGTGIMRGCDRAIIATLPLRLLVPIEEFAIQRTIRLCAEECAEISMDDVIHESEGLGRPGGQAT